MKKAITILLSSLVVFGVAGLHHVQAAIPAVYTNENFLTSTHDAPVSIFTFETGGFYGFTETGKMYRQVPIHNDFGVRLQRFSIDEAYFYVTDRGTIWADTDLIALSIYMSRVV